MARAKSGSNGQLSQAMANLLQAETHLVQTQALFVQNQTAIQTEMAELQRESSARFARIEATLLEMSRVLGEHGRLIQGLTDAVREKIGFKSPQ